MVIKDKKVQKLIDDICKEHYDVCCNKDITENSLKYLWYLYHTGTKKGDYKPFIFLAEINLLIAMGFLSREEKRNIVGMMVSHDQDNLNIAGLCILNLRNERIKKFGEFKDNENYKHIEYSKDVINPEDFTNNEESR
jgi:hypothetical protein